MSCTGQALDDGFASNEMYEGLWPKRAVLAMDGTSVRVPLEGDSPCQLVSRRSSMCLLQ